MSVPRQGPPETVQRGGAERPSKSSKLTITGCPVRGTEYTAVELSVTNKTAVAGEKSTDAAVKVTCWSPSTTPSTREKMSTVREVWPLSKIKLGVTGMASSGADEESRTSTVSPGAGEKGSSTVRNADPAGSASAT